MTIITGPGKYLTRGVGEVTIVRQEPNRYYPEHTWRGQTSTGVWGSWTPEGNWVPGRETDFDIVSKAPDENSVDEFVRHLEAASKIVESWPEWKRNIFGNIRLGKSSPIPGNEKISDSWSEKPPAKRREWCGQVDPVGRFICCTDQALAKEMSRQKIGNVIKVAEVPNETGRLGDCLQAVDQSLVEDYENEMADGVPQIVEAVKDRQSQADESRQRVMRPPAEPAKRREWWVRRRKSDGYMFLSETPPDEMPLDLGWEAIPVIEAPSEAEIEEALEEFAKRRGFSNFGAMRGCAGIQGDLAILIRKLLGGGE